MAKKVEVCTELEGYESSYTTLAEGQHSVEILVLRKFGNIPEGEMIYLSGDRGRAIYGFPSDVELEGLAYCSHEYFSDHLDCGLEEDVYIHANALKYAYGMASKKGKS